LPAEQVRNEIGAKLVAMGAIIAQSEARFGRQVKLLDHPILGPLTATQWRKLHLGMGGITRNSFSGFAKARRGTRACQCQHDPFLSDRSLHSRAASSNAFITMR
jgi:hypothetical protein